MSREGSHSFYRAACADLGVHLYASSCRLTRRCSGLASLAAELQTLGQPRCEERDHVKLGAHEISEHSIVLVERQLRSAGISSFRHSPDRRVHLVWGAPNGAKVNVEVKGNAEPRPAGGKGKLALDWWIDEDSPADVIALVDLSTERVWLLTLDEIAELAQQHSSGRHHLYMYVDPTAVLRRGSTTLIFASICWTARRLGSSPRPNLRLQGTRGRASFHAAGCVRPRAPEALSLGICMEA